MAVAVRHDDRMSVAEYRVWVESKPHWERCELLDGVPGLMSPPRERHQMIVGNLIGTLRDLTRHGDCCALPGLAILSEAMDEFAPIPDVVVRCGPMGPDGYASDPVFIAEVLSPSATSRDRGRKVEFYKSVPTLRHFLLVYQAEARIEVWRHGEAADWVMDVFGPGDIIELPELHDELHVTDVYDRVTF